MLDEWVWAVSLCLQGAESQLINVQHADVIVSGCYLGLGQNLSDSEHALQLIVGDGAAEILVQPVVQGLFALIQVEQPTFWDHCLELIY